MAYIQNIPVRLLCLSLLFLLPGLAIGQTGTQPRQIEAVDTQSTGLSLPSYEDFIMVSILDTIGLDDYRYHHSRLIQPHLFLTIDDSVCFVLHEFGDTSCVYIQPGAGVSDTSYQWIVTTDGGTPDTITVNELINFVSGTNITITQGATNITFDVDDMRDTCVQHLYALPDSSNRLVLTDCDSVPMDTVDFFGLFSYNDTYADSASVWSNDTVWIFRRDSSGTFIDSFPVRIPAASIDTDDQTIDVFTFDNGTRTLSLSIEDDGEATKTVVIPDDTGTDDQQLSQVVDGQLTRYFLEDGGFVTLHDSIVPDTYIDSITWSCGAWILCGTSGIAPGFW
jgi:hypothetical protein